MKRFIAAVCLVFLLPSISFAESISGEIPYPNAEEAEGMTESFNMKGRLGVAAIGGAFAVGSDETPNSHPRVAAVASSGTVDIPEGAQVVYAALYYGGSIHLDGYEYQGMVFEDFTPDDLNTIEDVQNNGVNVFIDGVPLGVLDNASRKPNINGGQVPHDSVIGSKVFPAKFGTLYKTASGNWGNRLNMTNYFKGKSGEVTIEIDPPERLDFNANSEEIHLNNPAGSAEYNSCTGSASWSLVVVYKHRSLPQKQIIIKDGDILQAWDYPFIHIGEWWRPKVTFDHVKLKKDEGVNFYVYASSGIPAGSPTPMAPLCTCGCGGFLAMVHGGPLTFETDFYFSETLIDPVPTWNDVLHRDSQNGPWHMIYEGMAYSQHGNEWTLFQSGDKYTEFPNLYEGYQSPEADDIQPVSYYESQTMLTDDVYGGHPWAGRGNVEYLASGNDMSVVKVTPSSENISVGEKSTTIWFKGDQKDVWKPQSRTMIRSVVLEIPLGKGGNGNK